MTKIYWEALQRQANQIDKKYLESTSELILEQDHKTGWFGYTRYLYGQPISFGSIKLMDKQSYIDAFGGK